MENLKNLGSSANALVVFDVVARSGSITHAADELGVSQVAVSRMIGRLEKALRARLFVRSRSGLTLTDDGRILMKGVHDGFLSIRQAMHEIEQRQRKVQSVKLSLSSAFIAHWLMPRYQSFQTALPHISLQFHVISGALGGSVDEYDLALRKRDGLIKTHQGWAFSQEVILPVCSAAYLASQGPFDRSTDAKRHTLIELAPTTIGWTAFMQATGLGTPPPKDVLAFSDYALVLQAAMLGRGVALGWLSGISHALLTGQLVPASRHVMETGKSYQLISNQRHARPEVKQVKDWMVRQMNEDIADIKRRYPGYAAQFHRESTG